MSCLCGPECGWVVPRQGPMLGARDQIKCKDPEIAMSCLCGPECGWVAPRQGPVLGAWDQIKYHRRTSTFMDLQALRRAGAVLSGR